MTPMSKRSLRFSCGGRSKIPAYQGERASMAEIHSDGLEASFFLLATMPPFLPAIRASADVY